MGDLIGELLVAVARGVGYVLFEFIVEILIRGVGYLICRIFRRDVDIDSGSVFFVGLVFWIAVIGGTIAIILTLD